MRRLGWLILACTCVFPAIVRAQIPPRENYVLIDTDAYVLLPAEFVAAPVVKRAEWSKDGRYLLVVRESNPITPEVIKSIASGVVPTRPPAGEVSLILWSRDSRKSTEVWKAPLGEGGIREIHWLPNSSVAILRTWRARPAPNKPQGHTEPVDQLVRLSATVNQVKVLTDFPSHELLQIHVSPTRPFALIQKTEAVPRQLPQPDGSVRTVTDYPHFLFLLRENGTIGPRIPPPFGVGMQITWTPGGAEPILQILDREATKRLQTEKQRTGIAIWRWFQLNPATGRAAALSQAPALYTEPPSAVPIRLKSGSVEAKEGQATARIPLLWLESATQSPHPRALVAANLESADMSPANDGILQITQGAAIVTPIMRMPKNLLAKMQAEARKAVALSNGKQIGLAVMMYSQDYDEMLPGPEGINDKITPYLKNTSVFDGFTYTFPGGPLKDVTKPAETELGWVNGPGGRAIIYVDGHVVWQPD